MDCLPAEFSLTSSCKLLIALLFFIVASNIYERIHCRNIFCEGKGEMHLVE